jgi:hypothetical protein
MSVRKRIWKTAAGEERQAWFRDYTGQSGKRHASASRASSSSLHRWSGLWRPIILTAIFTGLRASKALGHCQKAAHAFH